MKKLITYIALLSGIVLICAVFITSCNRPDDSVEDTSGSSDVATTSPVVTEGATAEGTDTSSPGIETDKNGFSYYEDTEKGYGPIIPFDTESIGE
ncbi:MAG: hypothetical protein ACI3XQ_10680 [Eubacteriales bacterium]